MMEDGIGTLPSTVIHPQAAEHPIGADPEASPSSVVHPASSARSGDIVRGASGRLTESQLTALWRGQRFPEGALVTRQGVPVRVIFQGRPGRGPGPDFRGAVIAGPSGVPLRGDVELHVRSSLFRAHGHAEDPAYRNVILHIVFTDDTGADTPLPGGGIAPVVALAPWVARRSEELERWVTRPLLWREPCHDAVMRLGADGAGAALEAEGDRRFDAKVALAAGAVRASGVEQALYEGLIGALGYGGNAPPMLALARLLRWRTLREAAGDIGANSDPWRRRAEALLLGSAGLLPSQRGHRGPLDPYVVEIEGVFAGARLPALSPGIWKLWGVRPENAAPRRIAAAAALLVRLGEPERLFEIVDAATVNDVVRPLSVSANGYWLHHYDACAGPCRLSPAFVGRSRALEIAINVVLPAAAASGDATLAAKARALYGRLPRPAAYGVTKFIEEALASEGIRVPVNARRAQGLLALQRDWCTKGGCGRCCLSERDTGARTDDGGWMIDRGGGAEAGR